MNNLNIGWKDIQRAEKKRDIIEGLKQDLPKFFALLVGVYELIGIFSLLGIFFKQPQLYMPFWHKPWLWPLGSLFYF